MIQRPGAGTATVSLEDSTFSDEDQTWQIASSEGSIAEMICPRDDAEAWAQFFVLADRHFGAAVEALRQLAECNLSEDNCANFEVANRRIRRIARAVLEAIEKEKEK